MVIKAGASSDADTDKTEMRGYLQPNWCTGIYKVDFGVAMKQNLEDVCKQNEGKR